MGFKVEAPDDLIKQLERLENVEEIAPRVIDAALPILENAIVDGFKKHDRTGELSESVKTGKARQNQYGFFGYVAPSGVDRKGVRNAEKAAYLENGTSKQPARPVVTPAVNSAKSAVLAAMQKEFDRLVGE